MSITDELRECIATAVWQYEDGIKTAYIPNDKLTAIADRIDAEHKAKVDEAYENGKRDGRADWLDETDGGYIKLPVDADGVPIHIGDYVETLIDAFKGEHGMVECLMLTEDGWCVDGDAPSTVRHYHEPTVEDVLREFAEKITDSQIPNVHPTYEEAISEYASKLRLAGEAE